MRAFVLFGLAATSCGFSHGSLSKDDAAVLGGDAPVDAPADGAIDAPIDAMPNLGTCNTTALTCIGGTPVAVTCNGGCWVKCQQSQGMTQPAAASACAVWGGKLAPIREQADNDCVAMTLFPAQASWIGFEQSATATMKASGWSWNSDNVTPTYTNWSSGQPNDSDGTEDGEEQCAYMPTAGTWQDIACSDTTFSRFSCRR